VVAGIICSGAILTPVASGHGVYDRAHKLAVKKVHENHGAIVDQWLQVNYTMGGRQSPDYVAIIENRSADVPTLNMMDGPQGVRNYGSGTWKEDRIAWPAAGCHGTAWSPEFSYYTAKLGMHDWKEIGANVALTPGVNVHRLPTNGRNWEYISGEDALVGELSADFIRGMQSENMLPALKHFALNQQELNRHGNIATLDEATLMETYLRAYQPAIDAGAGAIMCSYNRIKVTEHNDTWAHACGSEYLSKHLLRNVMGFKAALMTDWSNSISNTTTAPNGTEVTVDARGVVDWEMQWQVDDTQGLYWPIPKEARRQTIINSLTGIRVSGLMGDDGKAPTTEPDLSHVPMRYLHAMKQGDVNSVAVAQVAETLIMLKNGYQNSDGPLPINRDDKVKILLAGEAMLTGGGSGDSAAFSWWFPDHVAEALSNNGGLVAQMNMTKELEGAFPNSVVHWDFETDRVKELEDYDYIIAFGAQYRTEEYLSPNGTDGFYNIGRCQSNVNISYLYHTGEIDSPYGNCDYAGEFLQKFQQARKSGTKLISVTTTGGGFVAHDFLGDDVDMVDAAFTTYYPGQLFAPAFASVLAGDISPGGKLTHTIPNKEPGPDGKWYIQSPVSRFNPGLEIIEGTRRNYTLTNPAFEWDEATQKFTNKVVYSFNASEYAEGNLVGYKYFDKYKMKPLFEFGFGLSYEQTSYHNVQFRKCDRPAHRLRKCSVKLDVKMTRERSNVRSSVIQVYVGYKSDKEEYDTKRAVKELRGFKKVWRNGEYEIELPQNKAFKTSWSVKKQKWVTPCELDGYNGKFTIYVGHSLTNIVAHKEVSCQA